MNEWNHARRARLAALGVAACAGFSVMPAGAEDDVFRLGVVEVIAQTDADDTSVGVDTLDAETLSSLHRHDLSTALDLLPGVTVQNVGQRRERLVSVRGFSSRQVPLFIDGVPVYVPYDGNVDLSRFGVDYVSEIKLARGLASVLYGPNVLGGAINVVSRRPSAPLETAFSAGVESGEHDHTLHTRYTAALGGLRGAWYAQLTAAYTDAQGYALPDDFEPVFNANGSVREDGGARENADSRDRGLTARIGYLPGGSDEYALSYHRQDGDKNVPPYAGRAPGVQARFWQWPYWDKQGVNLAARNTLGPRATLRWRLYRDEFRNALNSFDDARYASFNAGYAFEGSAYDDHSLGGNADLEWRWAPAQVTRLALHAKQDVHREIDEVGAPEERYEDRSYAIAAEHDWRVREGLVLTPGYAYTVQDGREAQNNVNDAIVDQPVDRAHAQNAQLAAVWMWAEHTELLAGVSRKTRFPTIKDRFSFRLGSAIPNAALEPERALHYELGVERRMGSLRLRATLFQAELNDAIESVRIADDRCTAPNPNCTQLQNIGEQRNRGAELLASWQPNPAWQIQADASVLDRNNRSRPELRQIDTPEQKYRLSLAWSPLPRWTFKTDAQHESKRFSTTDGARISEDFTLVHAFARYAPRPQLGLELGARNLTDALYAYQEGFFEAGRTWLAQLDYRY